ncbi:MAG: hypothetical protein ED557_00805 [Balneola sp.]|nr:MAG: hypothetical protein ED557_00805 [Balneola sp.]
MKKIASQILILLFSFTLVSCSDSSSSFVQVKNPTGDNSSLPRLFTDNTGLVYLSWVEQIEDSATLFYSTFDGEIWSEPDIISASSDWFVNWADFPSVIGQNGSALASHWLAKTPGGTYSYNVEVSIKKASKLWNEPIVPHSDNTPTEHGFVSMIPYSDSSFYAIWLDGRNTTGGHGGHGDLSTAMTLRGAEISYLGKLLNEHELDNAVCDCCNTSLINIGDDLLAVYRNRTAEETRDIYVKKFSNGEWGDEKAVNADNWSIASCPVNGAMIDYKDGLTAVAWFTGADNKPMAKLSFSKDKGDSFLEPIVVDSSSNLGRVDVLIENNESAWVSWITRNEEGATLNLDLVSTSGKILQSHQIAEINPSRRSGFPQITKLNKGLLIAWTDIQDENKSVKTVILE